MSKNVLVDHPCFSNTSTHGRIHLAVAKACNIACKYCDRRYDCVNESRPGVTSKLLKPSEVLDHINKHDIAENDLKVIGIAGPGEPLFNDETFETINKVREHYGDRMICVSTNGLLLSEKIDVYGKFCDSVTVTVNTLDEEKVHLIYDYIGLEAKTFINRQLKGIRKAIEFGMVVKVNMVAIKKVNDVEIVSMAERMKEMGVDLVNVINLIPQNKLDETNVLSDDEYE